MRTHDSLLIEKWETIPGGHELYSHFPLARSNWSLKEPVKKLLGFKCPNCKSHLTKREIGPIVESGHSIYLFRFYVCSDCDYIHGDYFLDLGG